MRREGRHHPNFGWLLKSEVSLQPNQCRPLINSTNASIRHTNPSSSKRRNDHKHHYYYHPHNLIPSTPPTNPRQRHQAYQHSFALPTHPITKRPSMDPYLVLSARKAMKSRVINTHHPRKLSPYTANSYYILT